MAVGAVACGAYHSVCLTDDNQLYAWGRVGHEILPLPVAIDLPGMTPTHR